MALLWPLAGEELKRLRREALDPVVLSCGLRKARHLRPLRSRHEPSTKDQEETKAVARRVDLLKWHLVTGEDARITKEAKMNRTKIPMNVQPQDRSHSWLHFGDAIRVVLPGLDEDSVDICLCTCVRPGIAPQVGPHEARPTDAAQEEQRLAQDLTAWGRRAIDFVAITGADGSTVDRRSAWTIYRANEMDGFLDAKVHYGQALLLGQPETAEDPQKEVLLSCEAPSRNGGIGAAYQVMGRFCGFGHAAQGRRSWNTIFMLVPVGPLRMGDVVDVAMGVRIVPLSPYSYLHGPRQLQAMYFGLPNRVGRGCVSRALKLADGREELLVHAPGTPQDEEGWWDAEWLLQPLMLPPEPCVVEPRMTEFARWDRLRSAILERLLARQEAKLAQGAIVHGSWVSAQDRILPKKHEPNLLPPTADAPVPLTDQILVGKSFVASTFQSSYGLYLSDEDMQLLVRRFQPESAELFVCDEPVVNVDLFLDAVRGETSIGRSRTLDQLYTLLLKQVPTVGRAVKIGDSQRERLSIFKCAKSLARWENQHSASRLAGFSFISSGLAATVPLHGEKMQTRV
eukprot:Skav217719  [mRNA]  locus=scaffold2294:313998:318341:- [translate_table: standard]